MKQIKVMDKCAATVFILMVSCTYWTHHTLRMYALQGCHIFFSIGCHFYLKSCTVSIGVIAGRMHTTRKSMDNTPSMQK